MLLSIHWS